MEIKSRTTVVNPIILEEMPLPGLSVRHNFLWTLAGNFVYAGCQWGMVIVIYLPPAVVPGLKV